VTLAPAFLARAVIRIANPPSRIRSAGEARFVELHADLHIGLPGPSVKVAA
jgi:hypothetical protein